MADSRLPSRPVRSASFARPGAAVLTGACLIRSHRRPMTNPSLAPLNAEQSRAVEHGDGEARPLLIIAGAGSGKTNTLAHRVAHLVVQGADPRRILLLTFSRPAAAEMIRR